MLRRYRRYEKQAQLLLRNIAAREQIHNRTVVILDEVHTVISRSFEDRVLRSRNRQNGKQIVRKKTQKTIRASRAPLFLSPPSPRR